jgi:hypothetical protein
MTDSSAPTSSSTVSTSSEASRPRTDWQMLNSTPASSNLVPAQSRSASLGETGVGPCVAAGRVDDDDGLVAFRGNASGRHQGGSAGRGGGVADDDGHFGGSLFSVRDGASSVWVTSTWWCSATASAGSSEISSTAAAAFAGSTFLVALKISGQSRINTMIA